MRKHLLFILLLSIIIFSCSFSISEPIEPSQEQALCPLDTCTKVIIEFSLQGYNYYAPFTCFEWTDWGTGLEVSWTDGGSILFFTFPNHRICQSEFRLCYEEQTDCEWQLIEDCPRNNSLTLNLDSMLLAQSTLYLDVFLQDK